MITFTYMVTLALRSHLNTIFCIYEYNIIYGCMAVSNVKIITYSNKNTILN